MESLKGLGTNACEVIPLGADRKRREMGESENPKRKWRETEASSSRH